MLILFVSFCSTLAHLLRFFAHLILVLRLLKQPLPAYAANRILEAYVHVLEANDQDENLIAFYASCLEEESAVESYARFLLSKPRDCIPLNGTDHRTDDVVNSVRARLGSRFPSPRAPKVSRPQPLTPRDREEDCHPHTLFRALFPASASGLGARPGRRRVRTSRWATTRTDSKSRMAHRRKRDVSRRPE